MSTTFLGRIFRYTNIHGVTCFRFVSIEVNEKLKKHFQFSSILIFSDEEIDVLIKRFKKNSKIDLIKKILRNEFS